MKNILVIHSYIDETAMSYPDFSLEKVVVLVRFLYINKTAMSYSDFHTCLYA